MKRKSIYVYNVKYPSEQIECEEPAEDNVTDTRTKLTFFRRSTFPFRTFAVFFPFVLFV